MILSKLVTRDSRFFFALLGFNVNILRRRLFSFKTFFYLAIYFILFRSILVNEIVKFEINIIMKVLFDKNVINVDYVFSFNVEIDIDCVFLFELEINADGELESSINIISHFGDSILSRKNSIIFFFLL